MSYAEIVAKSCGEEEEEGEEGAGEESQEGGASIHVSVLFIFQLLIIRYIVILLFPIAIFDQRTMNKLMVCLFLQSIVLFYKMYLRFIIVFLFKSLYYGENCMKNY